MWPNTDTSYQLVIRLMLLNKIRHEISRGEEQETLMQGCAAVAGWRCLLRVDLMPGLAHPTAGVRFQ